MFCNTTLGANDAIEGFPVGRRIAFDAGRGRLWVVCTTCERWNLSPIDERWEIVEECERAFRDTRMRTSTENIGLARMRDGLDLVRIGAPLRPEFAAWRYGDQFGRRRKSAFIRTTLGVGAVGAILVGASALGGIGGIAVLAANRMNRAVNGDPNTIIGLIPVDEGMIEFRRRDLRKIRIVRDGSAWALELPTRQIIDVAGWLNLDEERDRLTGIEAENAIRILLPAVNRFGANRRTVGDAVRLLEQSTPDRYILDVAGQHAPDEAPSLARLPNDVRLALEMATHEDIERRAMQGELSQLEAAWRAAEEIAAIADNLLVPQSFTDKLKSFVREI